MSNTQDDNQYTDDFSDDSYEAGEENLDNNENSDDWDDDGYVGDDEAPQDDGAADSNAAQRKKKSSLSTIIIIAVAVIGCLGFLVLKFGGDSTAPAAPIEQTDANGTPLETAVSPETASDATSPTTTPNPTTGPISSSNIVDVTPDTQGFMMAPEKVENIVVKEQEPPPIEAPIKSPDLSAENAPDGSAVGISMAPDLTADGPSPAEFPTVANILKPQPDTKETAPDITSSPPLTEPVAEIPPASNMAEQLGAASADTDVTKSKEYQEIRKNLDAANQKIVELEQKIADQAKAVAPETAGNSPEIATLQEEIVTLRKKLQAQSTRTAQRDASVVRNTAKKETTASKSAPTGYHWTLRSASSGKALLYNQAINETKSVRVGDVIPTLGSITSIENIDGKWVIKGTTGQISR